MDVKQRFDLDGNPTAVAELTSEDELLIETLVDDELDENERGYILAKLDQIPGGWRACALAFLENQAFRAASRELRQEEISQTQPIVPSLSRSFEESFSRDSSRLRTHFPRWTFIAVSAAIAFACSPLLFKTLTTRPSVPNPVVLERDVPAEAEQTPFNETRLADRNDNKANNADGFVLSSVEKSDQPSEIERDSDAFIPLGAGAMGMGGMSGGLMGSSHNSIARLSPARAPIASGVDLASHPKKGAMGSNADVASEDSPIRTVTLNCPQYGLTNVSASCVENDHYDPEFLRKRNGEIPGELLEQVRLDGGRVKARREEYRFSLDDGRVLILPVDAYEFEYDSNDVR